MAMRDKTRLIFPIFILVSGWLDIFLAQYDHGFWMFFSSYWMLKYFKVRYYG